VQRKIAELMNDMDANSGVKKVDVYRHAMTGNDVSIHLHWDSENVSPQGSALGICLRSALAQYGLLSHEVWTDNGKKTRNGE